MSPGGGCLLVGEGHEITTPSDRGGHQITYPSDGGTVFKICHVVSIDDSIRRVILTTESESLTPELSNKYNYMKINQLVAEI